MGFIRVRSHDIKQGTFRSENNICWYVRLEKHSPKISPSEYFIEYWGKGNSFSLKREGRIGCKTDEPGVGEKWSNIRFEIESFLNHGYILNSTAIKEIDPDVFKQDTSGTPNSNNGVLTVKELENARRKKSDW